MQQSGIFGIFSSFLIVRIVSEATSQTVRENDGWMSASFRESSSTFYALQSCHQILHGNSGEFFSPDYLCSHPPLWCNWTVQVQRGMRVWLYLEDLTPESACHRKTDQIHLDESPASGGGGSRILEHCWRSAEYMSASNVVHVVQLISPAYMPPHRGFYGAYQAFGDSVPPDAESAAPVPWVDLDENKSANPGQKIVSAGVPLPTGDIHENRASTTKSWREHSVELSKTWAKAGDLDYVHSTKLVPPTTQSTRLVNYSTLGLAVADSSYSTQPTSNRLEPVLLPSTLTPNDPTTAKIAFKSGKMLQASADKNDGNSPENRTKAGKKRTQANRMKYTSDLVPKRNQISLNRVPATRPTLPEPSAATTTRRRNDPSTGWATRISGVDSTQTSQADTREHAESSRGNLTNASERREQEKTLPVRNFRRPEEPTHQPGSVLLEVTVEVRPTGSHEHDWDRARNLYTTAVQTLIEGSLETLNLKSVSAKRSKRLSDGALVIVWLQFTEAVDDDYANLSTFLQSNLLQLQGRSVDPPGLSGHLLILSVSIEDVDDCRTHLVACDTHAECVNQFGSYSCTCLHSSNPDPDRAVCATPLSDECGRAWLLLSVLCFLLCLLIALVLVAVFLLYRHYHRGRFLPRCPYSSSSSYSATDINNNRERRSGPAQPTPPLHLLHFSPLTPPKESEVKPPSEKKI